MNVVFDFLLRNPSDCIVLFDEPELHLHPELSYKLLQTLRTAGVIARIFEPMELAESWLRDPVLVKEKLLEIARSRLSHTVALIVAANFREVVGNVNFLPKDCHCKTLEQLCLLLCECAGRETTRVGNALMPDQIRAFTEQTYAELERSLTDEGWKRLIPDRPILNIFCSSSVANLDFGRFKIAYLRAAADATNPPFAEIESLFEGFASH